MKLPFLASFIIFISALSLLIKRHSRQVSEIHENFWTKEYSSNHVRRKSLDNLDYIKIPLDIFPYDLLKDHSKVLDCMEIISSLATQKIVNLTGITNTDLKLEYGTANITQLMEYDQNFTLLVRCLNTWAQELYHANYIEKAKAILEFAISISTDVSHSYYLLASIYDANNEKEAVIELSKKASALTSSSGSLIDRTLRKSYPYIG